MSDTILPKPATTFSNITILIFKEKKEKEIALPIEFKIPRTKKFEKEFNNY